MSEDLQCQRYYVLERISELREQIPQAMQAMVVFRARIEKYRQTDLSAARDTYDALRRVRDDLTQALADAQPLLMELESYALATMAGQLLRGIKGFDLMSTGYPFSNVYDDLRVCVGNNVLPHFKSQTQLSRFPRFLLGIPNNDDFFKVSHNRLHMPHRELLEHLKDKEPAYYYTDVLVESGKTLSDFINGR